MDILNTLAPLFPIIFLGAVLRWRGFATIELYREINRLVFYVGLPAMLFYKTAQARVPGDVALRLFGVLMAAMLLCIGAGYAGDAAADALAERIRREFSPVERLINTTGPVLGVHTGPGALALCGHTEG